jgi:hypothetical protein
MVVFRWPHSESKFRETSMDTWRVSVGTGILFLCIGIGPSFSQMGSTTGAAPQPKTTGAAPPSMEQIAPTNSKRTPVLSSQPPAGTIGRVGTAKTDPQIVPDPGPMGTFADANAFRKFLSGLRVETIICQALLRLYDDKPSENGCEGRIVNRAKSVSYLVTATNRIDGTYEIEIIGKSSELALKSANWVERHRVFVIFGFNPNFAPQITVIDFEPMVRTTAELFPERSDLFEHISSEHDSEIRVLQERIKSSITASLLLARQSSVGTD